MSIKQSSKEIAISQNAPIDPAPACWRRGQERECLRVEIRPGEVFLLPYQHFVGACLRRIDAGETLIIFFSSHRITLEGRHFEEIVAALQQFAVDWITSTPTRYRSLGDEASAIVEKLEVEEV